MLTFAITGGIGAGKSEVAKYLRSKGITILDADNVAKDVLRENTEIKHQLLERWGDKVFSDGRMNTRAIRDLIMADPHERVWFEALINPHIVATIERVRKNCEECHGEKLFGVESAVIIEQGYAKHYDTLIVVTAMEDTRLERAMQRDGAVEEQIRSVMAAQVNPVKAMRLADQVVANDLGVETLHQECERLYRWLLRRVSSRDASRSGHKLKAMVEMNEKLGGKSG